MNFGNLQAFCAIARCEKLTAAAGQLNLTQPALSRLVRNLEKEVGVPLFEHRGNSIALNQNGKKFFHMVEGILEQYDSCIREMKKDSGAFARTLTLALSAGGSLLPLLIHQFKQLHPEAWFVLKDYHHGKMETDVQFCFFCSVDRLQEEDTRCPGREPLYLTASASSPLAGRSTVRLSEQSSKNFLFADANNDMQQIQMHYCRMAGFTPDMDNIIERQNILMMLLELGRACLCCPESAIPGWYRSPSKTSTAADSFI